MAAIVYQPTTLVPPVKSPVVGFIACWAECTKKERLEFDFGPWKQAFQDFLMELMNGGPCFDLHNLSRQTKCRCMEKLMIAITPMDMEQVVNYLVLYCKLEYRERRLLILEWKRYAAVAKFSMEGAAHRQQQHCTFLLPGSSVHRICKNAIAFIVGKGRRAWDSIGKKESVDHGLCGLASNNSLSTSDTDKLWQYFYGLMTQGTPRATKLVANLAADGKTVTQELKDADAEVVELPACYSKRHIYRSFLAEHGWDVTFDNKSRKKTVTEKDNATLDRAISWPTFCLFWQQNFPKLCISIPAEDICDECVVFANRHKFLKRKAKGDPDDSYYEEENEQEPPVEATVTATAIDTSKLTDDEKLLLDDVDLANHEQIVIDAAKHVMMARRQRLLFIKKKEDAKRDAKKKVKQDERVYTFVADFAQNMYLPNFSAEQPGATYYYSPLNVYPFGIVDGSTEPTELTAHVYYEGTLLLLLMLLLILFLFLTNRVLPRY